jgi:hypothetical protein
LPILAVLAVNAEVTATRSFRGRLISRGRKRSFTEHEAFQSLTVTRGPASHGVMPRSKKRFRAGLRSPPVVIQGRRALEVPVTAGSLLQSTGEQKQFVISPGVRMQPRQEQPPHVAIFEGRSADKPFAHQNLLVFPGILCARGLYRKPSYRAATTPGGE